MLRIKICGITRLEDALLACECGADAIGFIFYEKSPRYITRAAAQKIAAQLPEKIARIGVYVNPALTTLQEDIQRIELTAAQIHGDHRLLLRKTPPDFPVIPAFQVGADFQEERLAAFPAAPALLLDGARRGYYGGTGNPVDRHFARRARRYGKIILAGGLAPDNVRQAVLNSRPYAIDVNSGIEIQPGIKDHKKLRLIFSSTEEFRNDRSVENSRNAGRGFPFA